jgi:hypothetical protein
LLGPGNRIEDENAKKFMKAKDSDRSACAIYFIGSGEKPALEPQSNELIRGTTKLVKYFRQ